MNNLDFDPDMVAQRCFDKKQSEKAINDAKLLCSSVYPGDEADRLIRFINDLSAKPKGYQYSVGMNIGPITIEIYSAEARKNVGDEHVVRCFTSTYAFTSVGTTLKLSSPREILIVDDGNGLWLKLRYNLVNKRWYKVCAFGFIKPSGRAAGARIRGAGPEMSFER